MILYFNTKLVDTPLINARLDNEFFYPVIYPRSEPSFQKENPFEILLKTLGSYADLDFSTAIFNIEVDLDILDYKDILRVFIKEHFSKSKVMLRFKRPSTVEAWIDDVQSHIATSGKSEPVLVVMNHDHPFVDYSVDPLYGAINEVFTTKNSFQKILYYSHAPEVISWAINGRGRVRFKQMPSGLYYSSYVDTSIDSIGIMTFETLLYIWSKAIFSGGYVGRIDWKGLSYKNLNLTTYVYPRELFRHYDGYNHITGLRLDNEVSRATIIPFRYPEHNLNHLLDFYYAKWLSILSLMIRDRMALQYKRGFISKQVFVDSITLSLELFDKFYLRKDVLINILDEEFLPILRHDIENKIYFNANDLYSKMLTEISLAKTWTFKSWLYGPLIRLRAKWLPPKFIGDPS